MTLKPAHETIMQQEKARLLCLQQQRAWVAHLPQHRQQTATEANPHKTGVETRPGAESRVHL